MSSKKNRLFHLMAPYGLGMVIAPLLLVTPARAEDSSDAPLASQYVQVGVSFAAEIVASAGRMCSSTTAQCILGSGGGIGFRVGLRTAGPFYIGAAYEFSKQDPSQIYRLAILQQARAEGRFYFLDTHKDTQPYILATAGIAAYGNEWSVDTAGPGAGLGIGFETQISRTTVFGVALTYRSFYLAAFHDGTGGPTSYRRDGAVQMVGLELVLEARDPLRMRNSTRSQ